MLRRSIVFILILAGLLAWAGLSFRRIEPAPQYRVADGTLLPIPPHLVEPGWHFLPRGLMRLSEYPTGSETLRVELTGEQAAHSREGSKMEMEAILSYSISKEHVLDLHRAQGPRYASGWLTDLVRRTTASRVAAVSYDVVRNRDPELPRSIRGELLGPAEAAGIQIASVRLAQVAAVGALGGAIAAAGVEPLPRRIVMIGVDSFTWRIVDGLMAAGRMPNMKRLVQRGARANLRTINPILSPVIWTSIATGMKPARHGIVDFVVTARDTGKIVPVTSSMRLVPALWNLLSRQEVDVDVVGWWATWPAEAVHGRVVTDRVAFQLFEDVSRDWKSDDPAKNRGKTHPPELLSDLMPLIQSPGEIEEPAIAAFLPDHRVPADLNAEQKDLLKQFRTVVAAGRTYHAIAARLFQDPGNGLKMIYYEGPDTTSHLFMRYRPPLMSGVGRRDMELFGGMVDRYYELQDAYIGEMIEAAGKDATVILLSDHGFKSDSNRPLDSDPRIDRGRAAEWHTPVGVLLMAGPDIRPGIELDAASVLDITPTVLALFGLPTARDMDGQPLTEAMTPEFLQAHPVAWIDSYGGARTLDQEGTVVASAGDAEMIEKLRSIGYIGEERMTAQNNRGIIALDDGDVEGAIAQFEHALAAGPAGPDVRNNLARAYLMKGDLDRALQTAGEVLRADPRNKQAEVITAGAWIRKGDLPAAERHLRAALATDSTLVIAWSKLGEVLERQGRDEEAVAAFEKAVAVAPLSPVEYNHIGNIHRKNGRIDTAMQAYRDALRADPQYIGAYNNLGLCLQEKGRLGEAAALYDKALLIRPENPVLRNSLATLKSLQGDRAGALAEVERAVKADPEWPVAQGNLATLLFESGNLARARPAFERWVKLEPENIESRIGYALTLLATQDQDGAIAQLNEVLKRDPANFRAHVALGETLLRKGDLEAAQKSLEAATQSAESVPRVWNSLGDVYLKRGLTTRAASAFERSLSLDPKQPAIRQRLAATASR